MDRRGFLLGLAGLAGAGAAAGLMLSPAEATVLGQLRDLPPARTPEAAPEMDAAPDADATGNELAAATTPDGTPIDNVQYWRHPRGRRRRRVCGWRRDRWGRRVRRCWYVWR
ncbi:hypothetical protein [Ancylobacter sp. TS-1]|uniref:hypothetical protein n=1 Tax=Ancylobacter sp. TS-1 TaxID=1850374 RepID=UPI001265C215|nr:hypothetical protein [Ancylobacter sp. TS-1]QFR33904.1 hypothetical protein GBB76_12710 [Ancylobacter sp. TS-1]